MSRAQVLSVVGALFEMAGILLVASPDLFPQLKKGVLWLRTRTCSLLDRIRKLLGRPRVVELGLPTEHDVALPIRPMTSAIRDWPLERKVEFLLARDQQAQADIHATRERIQDFERASAGARRDMEAGFTHDLKRALEAYLPYRNVGVVLLVLGVICMTAASLVGSE